MAYRNQKDKVILRGVRTTNFLDVFSKNLRIKPRENMHNCNTNFTLENARFLVKWNPIKLGGIRNRGF